MATASARRLPPQRHGHGWVTFAGTMLCIAGTLNLIYGIAAVDDAHFYTRGAHYVVSDLNLWGWFGIVLGAVQVGAAFSIWNQTSWGRWVGVGSAGANAVVQLLMLPGAPLLGLALLTVDILIMYGLIAYGGRPAQA